MNDLEYMKIAIELAEKGGGYVNPNPMVGAVIVKNNKIIGTGYHEHYGGLHAERNAINNCTESPKGATLYVTLEPCCHFGKTSPCTEAIIKSGIKNVVIGTLDINPKMSGKSIFLLEKNGINVKTGVLEDECKRLTKIFRKYISTGEPFVLMKYAMTIDGKISTYAGNSKWISSEESRRRVHETRHLFSSIMVGVNTIIKDNPSLTCRIENGKNPIRIICDTNLRTPIESEVVQTASCVPTYIATSCNDEVHKREYERYGCKFIYTEKKDNHIELKKLMKSLGKLEIDSVLLEGGAEMNWSALNSGIVDEVQVYTAPKIFGGKAKSPVEGKGIEFPDEAVSLKPYSISQVGGDILIESEVIYRCSREL